MQVLHPVDPYAGFDASRHSYDPSGWNGDSPLFGQIVDEVRPLLAFEVGTWKGQSAINTARHLQRLRNGAQLVCIDTWLGSYDMWGRTDDATFADLRLVNGYPTVYRQFLANVVHAGLQSVIIPLPLPSLIAARLLMYRRARADMIYIDASHEENDVYADIVYFWQTLRPGGVMLGDDYRVEVYPGVVAAVKAFCAENALDHEVVRGQHWVIRKPGA